MDKDYFRNLGFSFFKPNQFFKRNPVFEFVVAALVCFLIGGIPYLHPSTEDLAPVVGILAFIVVFWRLSESQERDRDIDKIIESGKHHELLNYKGLFLQMILL